MEGNRSGGMVKIMKRCFIFLGVATTLAMLWPSTSDSSRIASFIEPAEVKDQTKVQSPSGLPTNNQGRHLVPLALPNQLPANQATDKQMMELKARGVITTEFDHSENVMILRSNSGAQRVLVLDRSGMTLEFPFITYYVDVSVVTGADISSVIIDRSRIRKRNFALALGTTPLKIELFTNNSSRGKAIKINMRRHGRPIKYVKDSKVEECYLEQDCDVIIFPWRKCGLQSMKRWTPSENVHGYWRLKCNNCSQELTCLWSKAEWVENNGEVTPPTLPDGDSLRTCFKDHQLLFLGDSTLRGMMLATVEQVNTTLNHYPPPKTSVNYTNVGLGTNISLIYFNRNLPDEKSTFAAKLQNLPNQFLLEGREKKTLLAVGSTQWMTRSHLMDIQRFITKWKIPAKNVFVKLFSSGFHVPSEFTEKLNLSPREVMMKKNAQLRQLAEEYGYGVVDPLQMTMSRYTEFNAGACGCHFYGRSEISSHNITHYHIIGEINTVYTHMLLKKMCPF